MFFRPNASHRERAYTLLAIAWLCLAVYGIATSFVAESWVKGASGLLAVPIAIAFVTPVILDRHPASKVPSFGLMKRIGFYAVIAAVFYGFSWCALSLGAPSLFTSLLGAERESDFVVVAKSDGTPKRRDCRYSVRLKLRGGEWESKVCLDEEVWKSINLGDVVRGTGKYTVFGGKLEAVGKNEG